MNKLDTLKTLLGISDTSEDVFLNVLLDLAEKIALMTKDPYGSLEALPSDLEFWVVLAAKEMYEKKDLAGGLAQYSENGISISLQEGKGMLSYGLIGMIVPMARAPQ